MTRYRAFRVGAYRRDLGSARFGSLCEVARAVEAAKGREVWGRMKLFGVDGAAGVYDELGTVRMTDAGAEFEGFEPA